MELIIGGYAQGKLDYVLEKNINAKVYDENSFEKLLGKETSEPISDKKTENECKVVLNSLHKLVKKHIDNNGDYDGIKEVIDIIINNNPDIIIISDEIGNGIVPIEKNEKRWREDTGRLLCYIAQKACKVERIICKIPQRIK